MDSVLMSAALVGFHMTKKGPWIQGQLIPPLPDLFTVISGVLAWFLCHEGQDACYKRDIAESVCLPSRPRSSTGATRRDIGVKGHKDGERRKLQLKEETGAFSEL